MKIYCEYPIPISCSLSCTYCFHSEAFELDKQGRRHEKYHDTPPFTIEQFTSWRNKHLPNATFLTELSGGEISHIKCQQYSLDVIDQLDSHTFQIQTNGLGDKEFYQKLIDRKHRIDRIGFTFHREMIAHNEALVNKYIENVEFMHNAGMKVYVKELLITSKRDVILENKKFWRSKGIEFRLQDFKGYKGLTFDEYENYSKLDELLIHNEYKHVGKECSCRSGYKNVIIRGFDIFAGDVIACWQDPCVIGNIMEDWYNPDYKIKRDFDKNEIDIVGVEKIYRGTYPKDKWTKENEETCDRLTIEDYYVIDKLQKP